MKKADLLTRLGWEDPFGGYQPRSSPESWSWNFDYDFLYSLYKRLPQPELMVEVGSWLGRSALEASKFYATQLQWRNFTLICVDTWLGSTEHWTKDETSRGLPRVHGFPVLYEQFMSNVALSGLQDLILPLPQTSVNGARILDFHQLRFDWVYIDASHETMDVLLDMSLYWPLVKPGGVMFGDDWHWYSVRNAVLDFCDLHRLPLENSYCTWAIWKK